MVESGALEKRYAYMASRVRIPSPPPVLRIGARVYVLLYLVAILSVLTLSISFPVQNLLYRHKPFVGLDH